MQGPIERRHGIVVELLTTGALFGLGHFTHQVSTSATPPPLVWKRGLDAAFFRPVIVFLVLGAAAVWAYTALARAARPVAASSGVGHLR